MLIECLIRREGGSRIELDNEVYHFKSDGISRSHICEVSDKNHIKTLLAITEGYREYNDIPEVELPGDFEMPQDGLPTVDHDQSTITIELSRAELARQYRMKMGGAVPRHWKGEKILSELEKAGVAIDYGE